MTNIPETYNLRCKQAFANLEQAYDLKITGTRQSAKRAGRVFDRKIRETAAQANYGTVEEHKDAEVVAKKPMTFIESVMGMCS